MLLYHEPDWVGDYRDPELTIYEISMSAFPAQQVPVRNSQHQDRWSF
jgi:hypothetical protein